MKQILILVLVFAASLTSSYAEAKPLRWASLGNNKQLKARFSDARTVALICIFSSEVKVDGNISSDLPFWHGTVTYRATVVKTFKGKSVVGDKIKFKFRTDSIPADEKKRLQHLSKMSKRQIGSLMFIFRGFDINHSDTYLEHMDTPYYSKEMAAFLSELLVHKNITKK